MKVNNFLSKKRDENHLKKGGKTNEIELVGLVAQIPNFKQMFF